MEPLNFPEANSELSAPIGMPTDECSNLHVMTDGKQCLSLWSMSWRERLSALLFGRVWLCVLSGKTQPPVWLRAERSAPEGE